MYIVVLLDATPGNNLLFCDEVILTSIMSQTKFRAPLKGDWDLMLSAGIHCSLNHF